MKKFIFLFLQAFLAYGADPTYTSTLTVAPTSSIIERRVGASITINSSGGSSLVGASVLSVMPRVWITQTGSSVTSFAFGGPQLGPGGNVFIPNMVIGSAGSLVLQPMSFVFHAPSMYPAYGNSLQKGTQTYSVSAQVLLSNGTTLYPTESTITVDPITLPTSQVSGWH